MSLISLIIVIVIIGVILWAVNTYIPMQAGMKKLLNIVVIALVILWILSELGIFQMADITVGRIG